MPDLFQVIEGFFSGVVGFFYNILSSSALLLAHPIRGPLRLNARYLSKRTRQVGPTTFLFSLTLLIYVLLSLPFEQYLLSKSKLSGIGREIYGSLSGKGAAAVFIAAVTGTIIVDIAIRLFVTLTRKRRRRPVYIRRYGYIVSLAGLASSIIFIVYVLEFLFIERLVSIFVVPNFGNIFYILFAAVAIAVAQYVLLLGWLYIGSRATGIKSRVLRAVLCFLVTILFISALVASVSAARFYGDLVNSGGLEIKHIICKRKAGTEMEVAYVLMNHDSDTVIIQPRDNQICIGSGTCNDYISFASAGIDDSETQPLQVLDSGKTSAFRFTLRQIHMSSSAQIPSEPNNCTIRIAATTAASVYQGPGSSVHLRTYTPTASTVIVR